MMSAVNANKYLRQFNRTNERSLCSGAPVNKKSLRKCPFRVRREVSKTTLSFYEKSTPASQRDVVSTTQLLAESPKLELASCAPNAHIAQ